MSKSRKRTSVTDVPKCNTAHLGFKEDSVQVASELGCFQKQIWLDLLRWRENNWKLSPHTSKSCPPRGFWPAWCWRSIWKVMFCDFIRQTEFSAWAPGSFTVCTGRLSPSGLLFLRQQPAHYTYVRVVEELTCSSVSPAVCHSAVAMTSSLTHPDTAMRNRRRRAAKFNPSGLSCQSSSLLPLTVKEKGNRLT